MQMEGLKIYSENPSLAIDSEYFVKRLLDEYGNLYLRNISDFSTSDATQRYTSNSSSQNPESVIEEIENNEAEQKYPEFEDNMDCLINAISVESGYYYEYEEYFGKYMTESQILAKTLLLKYSRNRCDYPHIFKGILHLISHYDYNSFGTYFSFLLGMALHHQNRGIKKFALKVFDNWDSMETLHILRGIEPMKESWLEDYRQEIIYRLESKVDDNICHITSEKSTVKTGQSQMDTYQWMKLMQMP